VHKIVLTFDDGPVPEHTPRILDALANYKVPGLFFVVGQQLKLSGATEIVRRAASEGHLIGNHSFNHLDLTQLSRGEIRSQILRTHELISRFEPRRRLFRPPYGACNNTVKSVAKELGYEVVFWNTSSEDWRPENASSVWVKIAIDQISAQHVAICLCHDRPHTADYLPDFLRRVRQLGRYEFVDYYHRRDLKALLDGAGRRMRRWATRACGESGRLK
jgi:peptidoglycan/xylan/chitin deacetylase (PgdA/CDA1 family)